MLGFVGLGHMGEPMVLNLIRAGQPVLAWSRTKHKYPLVLDAGGKVADTVDEVFERCGVILMMLANAQAVDEVLGRYSSSFPRMVAGRVLVNMGTTAPERSLSLCAAVREVGGEYVEAPVSGSRKPAEAGQLVGMLAGSEACIAEVRPLLDPLLLKSVTCGVVPNALRMKLAVNLFLITQVTGLVESFEFAQRNGLDLETYRDVLDSGPMASSVSRMKIAKLIDADFSVQASLSDVLYNARLIVSAAHDRDLLLPVMSASTELLARAEAAGVGNRDMVAVLEALTTKFDGPARSG